MVRILARWAFRTAVLVGVSLLVQRLLGARRDGATRSIPVVARADWPPVPPAPGHLPGQLQRSPSHG
jgi:hypothetical protein